jgi:molybdenum cofactor cytidylyltransferase
MAEREDIDCLVPAAGQSARMGRWKPVLPFGTRTIIETVVMNALRACTRVILVTGYRGAELAVLFRGQARVHVVENSDWPLGMFSSIRQGAEHVRTPRFFIALGDMPWIGAEVYATLLEAPMADFVYPVSDGKRGHPVLCAGRVKDEVRHADPAAGSMREIASRLMVEEVPWRDDTIHHDIDTLEDLW